MANHQKKNNHGNAAGSSGEGGNLCSFLLRERQLKSNDLATCFAFVDQCDYLILFVTCILFYINKQKSKTLLALSTRLLAPSVLLRSIFGAY